MHAVPGTLCRGSQILRPLWEHNVSIGNRAFAQFASIAWLTYAFANFAHSFACFRSALSRIGERDVPALQLYLSSRHTVLRQVRRSHWRCFT